MSLLKSGLHPDASAALERIGITSDEIGQTVGYAEASAGTHAPDGQVDGEDYTCAVDFRIGGWTDEHVKQLLDNLGQYAGFAAWYRNPGHDGWNGVRHVHAVYAGCRMKLSLRNQIHAFCQGKNGLATNLGYKFHTPLPESVNKVREMFYASGNPING
jgi:hypothetical protein